MPTKDKEDMVLLNICWAYKQKLIGRDNFIEYIDRFRHSFEDLNYTSRDNNVFQDIDESLQKEQIKKVGRPIKIKDKELIVKIMELHKTGLSSRKISTFLEKEHGIKIVFNTVLNIIERAEERIQEEKNKEKKEVKLLTKEDRYLELISEMSTLDIEGKGDRIDPSDVPDGMDDEDDD